VVVTGERIPLVILARREVVRGGGGGGGEGERKEKEKRRSSSL